LELDLQFNNNYISVQFRIQTRHVWSVGGPNISGFEPQSSLSRTRQTVSSLMLVTAANAASLVRKERPGPKRNGIPKSNSNAEAPSPFCHFSESYTRATAPNCITTTNSNPFHSRATELSNQETACTLS
jgi:hypothetical protein